MVVELSVSSTEKNTQIGEYRAPNIDGAATDEKRVASEPPLPDNDRIQKNRAALLDRMIDHVTRRNVELRVERGERKFGFTYTILDKRTGEVLNSWPHDVLAARLPDDGVGLGLLVDQTA